MGIEDRDYYRDFWRKRLGHVERAKFRVPLSGPDAPVDYSRQPTFFRKAAPPSFTQRLVVGALIAFLVLVGIKILSRVF